jgi:deazaflavin-dependent oxidoreductase (nitroreductase family)
MPGRQPQPFTARQEKVGNVVIRLMSALNTWIFRATSGRLGGRFLGGAPVLLLTTIGRKSGRPRTSPLLYLKDGERYVIVGSKGGMSHHPLWVLNLQANPNAEVEIGAQRIEVTAQRATDAEKAALWPRLVQMYPSFDQYQARTTRNIPVFLLTPRHR